MIWSVPCGGDGVPYTDEAGVPAPPAPPSWLPWFALLIALVTSGLALRALFCAS